MVSFKYAFEWTYTSSNRFRFIRYRRWAITTALLSGARANQRQSYVSSDCPTGPVSCARAHPNSVARARSSSDADSACAYAESSRLASSAQSTSSVRSSRQRAAARWRDERTLDVLWAELARRLDSAYAQALSASELERARATLFGWARAQLTGPVGQSLETYDWRWFARAPLNNAVVITQRLYRMNLNLFEEIYVHSGANLTETIRAIQLRVFTQPGTDPYQALYSRPGLPADD